MQPFNDIRVLDLTHVLAGPFATYQLGVLGAEVIKIESPLDPDMVRADGPDPVGNAAGLGAMFLTQGSNKRALSLNLKSSQGREILKRLVVTADVLVENYRAGALNDLGLGYEHLSALNPGLIYCSMTGYGQEGPKREHTAYDNVIQAFSGLMYTNGTDEIAPIRMGSPLLDYGTGAQAAFAISAALYRRVRTGRGEHIDIAMLDAAIMLMGMHVTHTMISGEEIKRSGNDSPSLPGYACFETGQGKLMVGAFTGKQHADLWRALGDRARAAQVEGLGTAALAERREQDKAAMQEIFRSGSADEWERLLNEHKVPAARVRNLTEALQHAQLESRSVLQSMCVPGQESGVQVPVAAFKYKEGGPALRSLPPKVGEHNEEILGSLGYSRAEIEAFKTSGAT